MAEKPTAAFVLGLIGGIFLILGALLFVAGAAFVAAAVPGFAGAAAGLSALGFVCAIIVLLGSIMLYTQPAQHTMWGILVLVFSLVGFGPWNIFGGFVIGSILGLVGGILALVYRPEAPPMAPMPGQAAPAGWPTPPAGPVPAPGPTHCTQCGSPLPQGATRCPSCGTPVG